MAVTGLTLAEARRLVNGIGNQADAATRLMAEAWLRAWEALEPLWSSAATELVALATSESRWPYAYEISANGRVRAAIARSQEAILALTGQADQHMTEAARNAARLTVAGEPTVVASQLPPAARAAFESRYAGRTPVRQVEHVVTRTSQDIHALTLPLPGIAVEEIKRRLVVGVAVGQNPRKMARDMVRSLRGAYDLSLTRATNIARTETLDVYRETAALQQRANSDVLAGWTWLARLDKRCCPSCWSMHGQEFSLDVPGPLDHQQGRCARMPRLRSWEELGIPGKEPASTFPDAKKVFAELPQGDKLAIMGPQRLAGLQSGRVQWDDLPMRRSTSGWRDSYASRPVYSLGRDAA